MYDYERFNWFEILVPLAVIVWATIATWTFCVSLANAIEIAARPVVQEPPVVKNDIVDVPIIEERVKEPVVEPMVIRERAVEIPKLYTDRDAKALAKMVWGEARGVVELDDATSECQMAATVWTVLNRYDAGFEDSIFDVVTAPHQFYGYNKSHPVNDDILKLVYDVLDRWNAEKHGVKNVGRVLPAEYLWFHGDGDNNWFRDEFRGASGYWDWSLGDPYAV